MPTAVISGGVGGLGKFIGKKLSEDGFNVIALSRAPIFQEAEAAIKSFAPGSHAIIPCDITNERAVMDAITRVRETHDSIDVGIHAAVDRIVRKNLLEMDASEFEGQFGAGVFGGFCFLKEVGKVMKDQRSGVVIGFLSRALQAEDSHPRMAGYVVAKHAVRGLLAELGQELAPFNVAVNGIAPGFMDTQLNADLPKAVRQFIIERASTGGMKTPEDVARAVSFLCSEQGRAIHGKIFSFEETEIIPL